MTSLPSKRPSMSGEPSLTGRLAQVYLDVQNRVLHLLNDRARQLRQDGIPFTPAELARQPLQKPDGKPVTADDLPLVRAWRENRPQEATFVLTRPSGTKDYIVWSAAPVTTSDGRLIGISGTVVAGLPEPDWQGL